MIFVKLRNLAAGVALFGIVLGSGTLARAQNESGRIAEHDVVGQVVGDIIVGLDVDAAPTDVDLVVVGEGAAGVGDNQETPALNVRIEPTAEPGYWIGVQLEPPSETLRSQLGIAEKQGLIVAELFPDTPAVAAGFAKHDLFVKIDDTDVTDVGTLNKIVQGTKGEKELAVTLFRGGKQQVIEVTPAQRPTDNFLSNLHLDIGAAEDAMLYQYIPKGINLSEGPKYLELFHPGVMVDRSVAVKKVGKLPKDLSVSISKSGDKPAEISVKKGHIKWDVTENELDKLPADVRPHVERMLGRGVRDVDVTARWIQSPKAGRLIVTPPHRPMPATPVAPPAATGTRHDVQRQLDEVNRRLEGLQKALDALVKQRSDDADE